jgi:hypothetical protein
MNSETIMSYVNRYFLLVESFEVVDENNDGINEPGEYLIVKNIIVRNNGKRVCTTKEKKAHSCLTSYALQGTCHRLQVSS